MNKSCPVQPKEVTETYAKAAQIYADKLIAIRFDDVIEKIIDYNEESLKISKYKDEFVTWMAEAGYDPTAHPEQEQFWDKIMGGLDKKFPGIESEDVFDDLFIPPLEKRIGNYFDENKRAIASAIIEQRKIQYANKVNETEAYIAGKHNAVIEAIAARVGRLGEIKSLGHEIDNDMALEDLAYLGGMSAGFDLLKTSGDFILKQAKAADPDPEIQKRYFVDTLDRWAYGDNAYIDDAMAWETTDRFQSAFEDYLDAIHDIDEDGVDYGGIDDYISYMDDGQREVFSDYFNKKVGTTSGVPKKGRTPFLLAKKEFTVEGTVEPRQKKSVELTEKSKQILGDYLKAVNSGTDGIDIVFNNAEDDDQLSELLDITAKLSEERRKR